MVVVYSGETKTRVVLSTLCRLLLDRKNIAYDLTDCLWIVPGTFDQLYND